MKKVVFLLLSTAFIWSAGLAQGVNISGFGGYTFADKFSGSNFSGKVKDASHWGVALEYMVQEYNGIELVYQRSDPKAALQVVGVELEDAELGVNYIMLGGSRYMPASEAFWGYGGMALGAAIVNNKDTDDSATKFAWSLKLGGLIRPSERVGIKLQAQLYSMVQGAGGGLYFGTGGAGAGVSTYSTIYQFGLSGGLVVFLGNP